MYLKNINCRKMIYFFNLMKNRFIIKVIKLLKLTRTIVNKLVKSEPFLNKNENYQYFLINININKFHPHLHDKNTDRI